MAKLRSVSVVIPVKDGVRYLGELLEAIDAQKLDVPVETLIVDSGSSDNSGDIARAAGARVIEIPPADFGHGRTRNFAAEHAEGDAIAFLTQDATPSHDGWLAALIAPLDPEARVGLSFGPHLPRPDTSPMIARELTDFFGSFSPDGSVRYDSRPLADDPGSTFFSNVNSCVLRECWDQVRFRNVEYSEDQAFARDAMAAGWRKAYAPQGSVLHAHDYPFTQFMRRYFDEYRGLRETVDHIATRNPAEMARTTRSQVRDDLAYMKTRGDSLSSRLVWGARSTRHHAGKAVFSMLGSRAQRLPEPVRERLSLEGRSGTVSADELPARLIKAAPADPYEYVVEAIKQPTAPLLAPTGVQPGRKLHIAWVIPPFKRGSGGHMTIFTLIDEIERMGHSCSIWIHDPTTLMSRSETVAHREIVEHFVPVKAGVYKGFDDWHGADVALATGWQTAYPVDALPDCELKAYLVQDYEPDFYAASAPRLWAERTYELGFPCSCASPWLRDLMSERYGAKAEAFELGVDLDLYKPMGLQRDPATIVYYARPATPRRGTEMGLLALNEVIRRRPETRVVMFGDVKPPPAPFEYEFAGVVDQPRLARLYNQATAGLVISLTNYSRMPKEMMACGLPMVDVDHPSVISVFGDGDEYVSLAKADPISIADRLVQLLDDPARRATQAERARAFVQGMTWGNGAGQIVASLGQWLDERSHERNAVAGSRT